MCEFAARDGDVQPDSGVGNRDSAELNTGFGNGDDANIVSLNRLASDILGQSGSGKSWKSPTMCRGLNSGNSSSSTLLNMLTSLSPW